MNPSNIKLPDSCIEFGVMDCKEEENVSSRKIKNIYKGKSNQKLITEVCSGRKIAPPSNLLNDIRVKLRSVSMAVCVSRGEIDRCSARSL